MNSRKILKIALKNVDRKKAAEIIGVSLGVLNNQIAGERPYRPKGNTPNFLERFCNLVEFLYDENGDAFILEQLVEDYGFMLVKNPEINASPLPVLSNVSRMVKRFSDTLTAVSDAAEDGLISEDEAAIVRLHWEKCKRQVEEFVLAAECGYFGKKEDL